MNKPSPMPLVYHARRLLDNLEAGNPFVTAEVLKGLNEVLTSAYLTCRDSRISNLLKVEVDRLESLPEQKPVMFKAELQTRNFTFEAIAESEAAAKAALLEGLDRHAKEFRLPPDWAHGMIEDFNVMPMTIGGCVRDRGSI